MMVYRIRNRKDKNLKCSGSKKKRRIVRFIFSALCIAILLMVTVNVFMYYRLKKDYKRSLKNGVDISLDENIDKIDLVGLLDSYGVPYSEKVDYSFMDLIENELERQGKINSSLDLYNLYINKNWHLKGIFRNGITINEMIDMKNFSLDFTRHKYGSMIKDSISYEMNNENGEESIYEYIAELNNPVILYSACANDLFYYFGASLESLSIKKGIELIENLNRGLDILENNVNKNVNIITECNHRSQIFIMGLYVPSDNFFVNRVGTLVINKINKRLRNICERYDNAYYVDVSPVCFSVLKNDFHPAQNGHRVIANKLSEAISENLKPIKEYPYEVYKNEDAKLDTISADEFLQMYKLCKLPKNDYVEYSVAIEWVLDELDCNNISYQCLVDIEDEIIERINNSDDIDMFKQGFSIVVIEHKILDGIIEADFSLHPESKCNDKLSLIDYYDDN